MSEKKTTRIGVIGTGHLGRHHVRILSEMEETQLVGIYDQRPEAAAALAEKHDTTSFSSYEELAEQVEAIVLAVPTFAHARLGRDLLARGLHLMVEKPITSTLEEADELLAAAAKRNRILAVGHVEFYNPAVQALLQAKETPRFIEAERLAPFTPRSLDVDVLLDLMIHDLQILHALDPSPIHEIRATGIDVLSPRIDIANVRVELESGVTANITASRVSAEPSRKLRVFAHQRYFSLDYRQQEIKGFRLREEGTERHIAPIEMPIQHQEPLRAELEAFVGACQGKDVAYVDGAQGRRALETALRITEQIRQARSKERSSKESS